MRKLKYAKKTSKIKTRTNGKVPWKLPFTISFTITILMFIKNLELRKYFNFRLWIKHSWYIFFIASITYFYPQSFINKTKDQLWSLNAAQPGRKSNVINWVLKRILALIRKFLRLLTWATPPGLLPPRLLLPGLHKYISS